MLVVSPQLYLSYHSAQRGYKYDRGGNKEDFTRKIALLDILNAGGRKMNG